jgi:ribonuclease HII
MLRALDALKTAFPAVKPAFMLVDSIKCVLLNTTPGVPPYDAVVRGDQLCLSIAAASILAKVTRDAYMIELDGTFPAYGFAVHKGYGVPSHQAALKAHGVTAVHRKSFRPMAQMRLEGF